MGKITRAMGCFPGGAVLASSCCTSCLAISVLLGRTVFNRCELPAQELALQQP